VRLNGAKHGLLGHRLGAGIEGRWQFLEGLFPPRGAKAPTHLFQHPLVIVLDHRVNRCRWADIVARLKIRRRRWVGQPVERHQLAPRVHPGEATAHGLCIGARLFRRRRFGGVASHDDAGTIFFSLPDASDDDIGNHTHNGGNDQRHQELAHGSVPSNQRAA
jgi:hypothetical protein